MIRRLTAALAALLLSATAAVLAVRPAGAQDLAGGPPSRIEKAEFESPKVARGATARLRIEFDIAPGYHIYAQSAEEAQRPVVAWELPKGWTAGKIEDVSKPHEFKGFGTPEMVHEGKPVLSQTFTIGADAALGATELKGTAEWMLCNDSICEFAKGVAVKASVEVVAAEAGGGSAAGGGQAPPAKDVPGAGAAGAAPVAPAAGPAAQTPPRAAPASLASLLGQAVFWGFLTVLTPCVFPLLPVTVSFFAKQKGPALPRSLVYACGIVFTITVIGLIFKSGLDVMARGWVFNLAVGILFLALSLSLFGLFDLKVPDFLTNWSSSKTSGSGLAVPFFMAVTLALTSFSCSMPFLATMFTQFEEGNVGQAVLGLVVYGSTMAAPFFFCSLFPAALQSMPRAGAWMNAIKVTMGFVEFALAFKFLRTVTLTFGWDWLPRGFVLAIWVACALGAALYLFGFVVLPHDTKVESIGVFRLVFALTFLASGVYFLAGVHGRKLADWVEAFLQTSSADYDLPGGGSGQAAQFEWPKNDWDGALRRAALSGRPVLLDFTGVG
jgi:thiol:disulfide interchange protein